MHELALVEGILTSVLENAEKHGIKRIDMIKVVIGELTAAMPEAVRFSFQVLSRDTPAENARLEIEKQPLELLCLECRYIFNPEPLKFCCPKCESRRTDIKQGRDLYVDYFEGQ